MSAADVVEQVGHLRRRSAGWPEILALLNPDGDAESQRLLEEVRRPHLFAAHVGLNVIEEGCRRALAGDAQAGRRAGLRAAVEGMNRIVG
jgi:hypothetical protein